jgi:hypothetical protein
MPKFLPVINTIDPTKEQRFASLRAREAELMREVSSLTLAELSKFPLLSGNAKTSVSLDFPIGHTCTPTALCARMCYASRPGTPARWDKSLRMRLRNLRYFQLATPREAAARLEREFSRARRAWATHRGVNLDFLRVNGTGDLTIEVVRVLNLFAGEHPDVSVWVVSRLPTLAGMLVPRPNLYLQLSTDSTTTSGAWASTAAVLTLNPRAYTSFLRTKPDEDTHGAAIVFNEKRTEGLPYSGPGDCPADAGRIPLDNVRGDGGTACSKCRKCFSPRTLERQRGAVAA